MPIRQPSAIQWLYDYWRMALVDLEAALRLYETEQGERGFHDLEATNSLIMYEPRCGWFRMKVNNFRQQGMHSPWLPVVIWLNQPAEDGELVTDEDFVARIGTKAYGKPQTVTFDEALEVVWCKVMKHPVSKEAYDFAFETGRWADDPPPKPERSERVDVRQLEPIRLLP